MPKCWKESEEGLNLMQMQMRPTMGPNVYTNDADLNQKIANAMNELDEDNMDFRWGWAGL